MNCLPSRCELDIVISQPLRQTTTTTTTTTAAATATAYVIVAGTATTAIATTTTQTHTPIQARTLRLLPSSPASTPPRLPAQYREHDFNGKSFCCVRKLATTMS